MGALAETLVMVAGGGDLNMEGNMAVLEGARDGPCGVVLPS